MTGLLRTVLRVVWWLFVIAVLLLALTLSSVRLLVTTFDDYQEQVTAWAEERIGFGIRVGGVDTGMHGLHLALVLEEVELINGGGEVAVRLDELRLSLAGLASIAARDVVFGELVLSGTDLRLEQDSDGRWRVSGMGRAGGGADPMAMERLRDWLFSQQRLILRDTRIHWNKPTGIVAQDVFTVAEARLVNHRRQHQLEFDLQPNATTGGRVNVRAFFEGPGTDPRDWEGTLYTDLGGLDLGGLEALGLPGLPVAAGRVDLQLWSDWRRGRLVGGEGDLSLSGLAPRGADTLFSGYSALEADLTLEEDNGVWMVRMPWLRLGGPGQSVTAASLGLRPDGAGGLPAIALRLGTLDLERLGPWFDALAPEGIRERLTAAEPRGGLHNVAVDYHFGASEGGRWTAYAGLDGLSWDAVKPLPATQGLTGSVWADARGGAARLRMENGRIAVPYRFREGWPVAEAEGLFTWQRRADGLHIQGHALRAANSDVAGHGRLALHIPGGGAPPFVDLGVRVSRGDARSIPRYMPVAIMPSPVVEWLDRAFLQGQVTGGQVLVHSRIEKRQFPYPRQRDGRFELKADFRGGRMNFDPRWPNIDAIAGTLHFHQRGMTVNADGARYGDATIGPTRLAIGDFRDARVELTGSARGEAGSFIDFVQGMPLKEPLSSHLPYLAGHGPLSLDLDLTLPLGRAEGELAYRGKVQADGEASLGYQRGGIELWWKDVEGRVAFDEGGYRGEGLTGEVLDGPVTVELQGSRVEAGMEARIRAHGEAQSAAVRQWLPEVMASRVQGRVPWRLVVDQDAGEGMEVQIDSSLDGLAVALPHPLGKETDESRPTRLLWQTPERTFTLQHGDVLAARGRWRDQLPDMVVELGGGRPDRPAGRGIWVTGSVTELDTGAWRSLMPEREKQTTPAEDWRPFWAEWELVPLSIHLDRLHMLARERDPEAALRPPPPLSRLRPAHIPPLDVRVDDLRYGGIRLGRFELEGNAMGRLFNMPLTIEDGNHRITGQLDWDGRRQRTEGRLSYTADNAGKAMKALGLSAFLEDGELDAGANVGWAGGPGDFHLQRLEGDAAFEITDGRLLQVEPGAGRALGLFSLRALPRRLGLDFRDLFGQGLGFETLRGKVDFDDGDVLFRSFNIDSSVARIEMRGRTGLVARDLDQRIIVIPGDGSHFFLPSALIWGPQAGALVWLAERVLRLDEVTRYTYLVTGTWDDPKVERREVETAE